MKQSIVLGMGILIGGSLGAGAVSELHAETKNPVYVVAEVHVKNPEAYIQEFVPKARATIEAAGGRDIAVGGSVGPNARNLTLLQGKAPGHVVIMRWRSMAAIKAWWNSADYKAARQIGNKYATFRFFAVKGIGSAGGVG